MPLTYTAIRAGQVQRLGAVSKVSSPECGGIATFLGTVRSSAAAGSRTDVVALEYEAHPTLAPAVLEEIAQASGRRWDVRRVVVEHRTGRCALGDATVIVACAAQHRADALDACRWMIEEIKRALPIWKREIYSDDSRWVSGSSAPPSVRWSASSQRSALESGAARE